MKVTLDKDVGYLTCKDRHGKKTAMMVKFPLETLLDWYPLNVNYEYRYDEDKDLFFLAPLDYKHPRKYGIKKRRRTKALEESASFKFPNFYVKEVREENDRVLKQAEELGIHNLLGTDARLEDVKANYMQLAFSLDFPIKDDIIDRAYENMTEKQWQSFYRSEEDSKEEILYSFATQEELDKLYESGTIRVLISLMRKGAKSNEL